MSTRCLRFVTCRLSPAQPVCSVNEMARADTIGSVGPNTLELRGAIPLYTHHCLQASPLYPHPDSGLNAQEPTPLQAQDEDKGADTASVSPEEQSEREEHKEVQGCQGPLPDLLPRNQGMSMAWQQQRVPGGEGWELEVQRVATQLRLIGDDLNTALLYSGNLAPPRPLWRYGSRALLQFISQALRVLYRLT